jgi:hypothetical protein
VEGELVSGVIVAAVEYWDVNSNPAAQLFKMAKAVLTGEPPRNLGEHRRVRI